MTLNSRCAVINFVIHYSGVLQFNHSITNLVRWGFCVIESLIILHTHTRAQTHTHTHTNAHAHTRAHTHARAHTHTTEEVQLIFYNIRSY